MEWKLTVLTQGWLLQCFNTCCLIQELFVNGVEADCTHPGLVSTVFRYLLSHTGVVCECSES